MNNDMSSKKESKESKEYSKEEDVSSKDSQQEGAVSVNKKEKKSSKDETPAKLKEQLDELNDKYLRLFSEFDNYRKRTLKEKIELRETASEDVIVSLLPVLDDFERAIQSFDDLALEENSKEGILLIFNKFLTVLNQKGLEQMKTIGEPFDTDYHEAITKIPAPSKDMKGKVIDEIEKGYLLHDKVIRYAKVVIGS